MKIIADGKIIRENVSNMRQALIIACNHGECLNAKKLTVTPDAAKKEGGNEKDTTPKK
jgi:hypothetical protein